MPVFFPRAMVKQFNCLGADVCMEEKYQQAREKLRQKAKIKNRAYIQLREKVLQTVHQTFEPDILLP